MFRMIFAAGLLLQFLPARAGDGASESLGAYDQIVTHSIMRESRSECLARARVSKEIVVCGPVQRYDRYRLYRSGATIIVETPQFSPAEAALAMKSDVDRSLSAVGFGYRSTLADTVEQQRGLLRRTYGKAVNMVAGHDPDDE